MSLKNLEKISEEIHRTRGTDLGITPPGPREPGVGATDDDDYEDPSSSDTIKGGSGKNNKLKNLPIADIMNHMEHDNCNSLDATSLDTNSIFSEDKDDEDYAQSLDDTSSTKRGIFGDGVGSNSMTTNSRNEPADVTSPDFDNHELNLEELRQKVKVLAVRPVEGGDGQTKDCWESELNETVNKLDRLMMLQENNTNVRNLNSSQGKRNDWILWIWNWNSPCSWLKVNELQGISPFFHEISSKNVLFSSKIVYNSFLTMKILSFRIGVLHNSPAKLPPQQQLQQQQQQQQLQPLVGGLMEKPPKPIKYSQANSNHGFYTPTHTVSSSLSRTIESANSAPINSSQSASTTTKNFLNSSLQVVQQKMEDLLPINNPTTVSSTSAASSITKELPLLSRISNEISANTANTVKVLKRRLSLN